MATTTKSITIRRPIEDVFAILTDVENTGKWFPGNVEEHWTSPSPHGVGSTRHAVVTMLGRRTENDAVTTEYQPPYRAAMKGTSPNAPFLVTLRFVPDPTGRASTSPHRSRSAALVGSSGQSSPRCTAGNGPAGWRTSSR